MPWLRLGDTSANHPIALAVLAHDDVDDRLLNELFGFAMRCATQAAAHKTDYIVTMGTAVAMAGTSRAKELLDVALFAGYFTETTDEGGRRAFRITEDPEFIHMRLKEEIEWERGRRADVKDHDLVVPVRLRDGDTCRYCDVVVNWADKKSRRGATYDHLTPGTRARTSDDLVVACLACNASLGDQPRSEHEARLLPAPVTPYFHAKTIEWLKGLDYVRIHNLAVPARPGVTVKPGEYVPGRDPKRRHGHDSAEVPESAGPKGRTSSVSEVDPAPVAAGGPLGPDDTDARHDPAADGSRMPPPDVVADTGDMPSVAPPPMGEPIDPAPGPGGPQGLGEPSGGGTTEDRRIDSVSTRYQRDPADRQCEGSGYAGTGRDGTGWALVGSGPGLVVPVRERDGLGLDGRANAPGLVPGSSSRRRRRR